MQPYALLLRGVPTERLLLREWRDEDAEHLAAMSADALVMEHLGGPMSREATDAMLGFETHGLDAIVAFTVPPNARSWRVMAESG